ncbi:hypothetical protein K2X33_06810 [bacterium]|nr:hypothetical protein [bacterium]
MASFGWKAILASLAIHWGIFDYTDSTAKFLGITAAIWIVLALGERLELFEGRFAGTPGIFLQWLFFGPLLILCVGFCFWPY